MHLTDKREGTVFKSLLEDVDPKVHVLQKQ